MDRTIGMAVTGSLVGHLFLLGVPLATLRSIGSDQGSANLEVIYEVQRAEPELQRLQRQAAQLSQPSHAPASAQAPALRIRIPDRPVAGFSPFVPGEGAQAGQPGGGSSGAVTDSADLARSPVVDLTNLVDAAQGDPVLLSYFGAIREQIQRTADRQRWAIGKSPGGVVYISFTLTADGKIGQVNILTARSAPAPLLHNVALGIIQAAAPFPPFPPSVPEPSKTIVVPLEFLLTP